MNEKKKRVLVVDDSAAMCQLLASILDSDPGLQVVGTAPDPYAARDMIKILNPDVLTLDIEMPLMDGLAFLRNLMRLRPMPVIMCSTLTQRGAAIALDALAMGAIDVVGKPVVNEARGIDTFAEELIAKVKAAAQANIRACMDVPIRDEARGLAPDRARRDSGPSAMHGAASERIIAIGASTGGTEAIKEVLSGLPGEMPGIVVVQHIPKAFSSSFARRMDATSVLEVCEARDGQAIQAGHAYIAPGDQHLLVVRDGAGYRCKLSDGQSVNRHRPSVDVLFRSVAQSAGRHAIGVILTGMGRDGALGMKEMREAGAATLGQDEDSSVVWGMPGAAWQAGAVQALHPLPEIAGRLVELVEAAASPQPSKRESRHITIR